MSAAADVQLVGFNMTLDFWATEQPVDPQTPFRVDVRLLPVRPVRILPAFADHCLFQ